MIIDLQKQYCFNLSKKTMAKKKRLSEDKEDDHAYKNDLFIGESYLIIQYSGKSLDELFKDHNLKELKKQVFIWFLLKIVFKTVIENTIKW